MYALRMQNHFCLSCNNMVLLKRYHKLKEIFNKRIININSPKYIVQDLKTNYVIFCISNITLSTSLNMTGIFKNGFKNNQN